MSEIWYVSRIFISDNNYGLYKSLPSDSAADLINRIKYLKHSD